MTSISIDLTALGGEPARTLVAEIVAAAAGRGIDQAALAARAGISAESLSRLKKAGGCRLATALDLARAAGLRTIELVDRPARGAAASIAAGKLSAGRQVPIGAEDLVRALLPGRVPPEHKAHLYGVFEELPIEALHDLILDEGLDYGHLARLARDLGAEGESLDWLAEMAGDGVADAA